jgi:hypothetical protein
MLSLLFYESAHADGPSTTLEDIDIQLMAIAGVELGATAHAPYRTGRWRDPATGSTCTIDLGTPPLEEDPIHPPRAYDGWREVGLTVGIPLAGPHWLCAEALQFVEHLLSRLPQLRALDSEDSERGVTIGPGTWSRPRVLASWERQHTVQNMGRTDIWRMNRLSSVCLWRYRRERAAGSREHAQLLWPEAFALLDLEGNAVRSAAFWRDPHLPLALPPVEVLIISQGLRSGVLSAADLASVASPTPLALGSAAEIRPGPAVSAVYSNAPLLPNGRFRALGDLDWSD